MILVSSDMSPAMMMVDSWYSVSERSSHLQVNPPSLANS